MRPKITHLMYSIPVMNSYPLEEGIEFPGVNRTGLKIILYQCQD